MTNPHDTALFAIIFGVCLVAFMLIKGAVMLGRAKATSLATKPKSNNPICSFDGMDCNEHMAITLSGCQNCHNCDRGNNGVRATGAMPNLEAAVKATKKVVIAVTGRSGMRL